MVDNIAMIVYNERPFGEEQPLMRVPLLRVVLPPNNMRPPPASEALQSLTVVRDKLTVALVGDCQSNPSAPPNRARQPANVDSITTVSPRASRTPTTPALYTRASQQWVSAQGASGRAATFGNGAHPASLALFEGGIDNIEVATLHYKEATADRLHEQGCARPLRERGACARESINSERGTKAC